MMVSKRCQSRPGFF